jgi:hypothetical protein
VIGGVGIAAIFVGAAFGVRTFSKESAAKDVCPGAICPTQEGLDLHNAAHTSATISTIGFVGGLAGIAVGAILVATSGKSAKSKRAEHAWIGASSAGVSCSW